jgi:hypothetical protein
MKGSSSSNIERHGDDDDEKRNVSRVAMFFSLWSRPSLVFNAFARHLECKTSKLWLLLSVTGKAPLGNCCFSSAV